MLAYFCADDRELLHVKNVVTGTYVACINSVMPSLVLRDIQKKVCKQGGMYCAGTSYNICLFHGDGSAPAVLRMSNAVL